MLGFSSSAYSSYLTSELQATHPHANILAANADSIEAMVNYISHDPKCTGYP